jgi:membrane protein
VTDHPWAGSLIDASAGDSDCLNSTWQGRPGSLLQPRRTRVSPLYQDVLSGEVAISLTTAAEHRVTRSGIPQQSVSVKRWPHILRRSGKQFKRHDLGDRAAALTYFGVLAIFPGMLVLVSIFGLLGHSTTQGFLDNLQEIAPSGVNSFLRSVVSQVQGRATTASVAAIVGIVIALWSASGYVAAFMRASNAIYNVTEGRPITRTAPVRVGVTVAMTVMLVISVLIIVVTGPVARQVGDALGIGDAAVLAWGIAKWPVLLVVVWLMFSLLYWACPNVKQTGRRWITPGAAIAIGLWLVCSGLFALYVSFSGSYNKTYGSLATVIIFLVWLWISNIALLMGLEFDAERKREQLMQAGLPPDLEPFVEVRDTRKMDEPERRRIGAGYRPRRAERTDLG